MSVEPSGLVAPASSPICFSMLPRALAEDPGGGADDEDDDGGSVDGATAPPGPIAGSGAACPCTAVAQPPDSSTPSATAHVPRTLLPLTCVNLPVVIRRRFDHARAEDAGPRC